MIGINEVAKKANVSIATVSNVINNKKPVSLELRQRVEAAIRDLDYQVNDMASSMKKQKTNNIGVILPKISHIYFPEVLQGIDDAAKNCGYKILYFNSGYDFETEKSYVNLVKAGWVDGIIIDSCCPITKEKEYAKFLNMNKNESKTIPVVSLERRLDSSINFVGIDNKLYAHMATEYLVKLGHRNIVHIGGPQDFSMCVDNLEGYKKALQENNIEVKEEYITYGQYTPISGYDAMKVILNRCKGFSAVFSASDQMAIGAIKAIKEAGLKVPDDVAVIGFDNIFVGTLIEPALSTINVPRYKIGYEAVDLIAGHINEGNTSLKTVELECNLIKRRSTEKNGLDGWDLCGW